MKNLLVIALLLAACGGKNSKPSSETTNIFETTDHPILGTPKILGTVEVAERDFPGKMNWSTAVAACKDLGSGWRLPTQEELKKICEKKAELGGFTNDYYWSSREDDQSYAWSHYFGSNDQLSFQKNNAYYVRAVRSL
jgi:hypothetical protein